MSGRNKHAKTKALSLDSVILLLETEIARAEGQKSAAKKLGISPQYLHDVINYRREPGPKVLRALGLKQLLLYVDVDAPNNVPELMCDYVVSTVS